MKSNVIKIDNLGKGFDEALTETRKVARYQDLGRDEAKQLRMIAEEMLGLARSAAGVRHATFWLETEGNTIECHLKTTARMDKEIKAKLLSSSTSGKNEITNTLTGKLRDAFEQALLAEAGGADSAVPEEFNMDVRSYHLNGAEWDGFEKTLLKGIADNIKIGIRGKSVEMTISKLFE